MPLLCHDGGITTAERAPCDRSRDVTVILVHINRAFFDYDVDHNKAHFRIFVEENGDSFQKFINDVAERERKNGAHFVLVTSLVPHRISLTNMAGECEPIWNLPAAAGPFFLLRW